jgi:hypothetical protein
MNGVVPSSLGFTTLISVVVILLTPKTGRLS